MSSWPWLFKVCPEQVWDLIHIDNHRISGGKLIGELTNCVEEEARPLGFGQIQWLDMLSMKPGGERTGSSCGTGRKAQGHWRDIVSPSALCLWPVVYGVKMGEKNSEVRSQKSGVRMEGRNLSPTHVMFCGEPKANTLFCVLTF